MTHPSQLAEPPKFQSFLSYGEGSVYPVLHSLEALVRAHQKEVSGRERTYYRLTATGRKRLDDVTAEFERTVKVVRMVLGAADVLA